MAFADYSLFVIALEYTYATTGPFAIRLSSDGLSYPGQHYVTLSFSCDFVGSSKVSGQCISVGDYGCLRQVGMLLEAEGQVVKATKRNEILFVDGRVFTRSHGTVATFKAIIKKTSSKL